MSCNKKVYNILIILSIGALILPVGILAQTEPPHTLEEAKDSGLEILRGLPGAVKKVWQEEAVPLWQKMWNWVKSLLEKIWNWFLGILKNLWNWFLGLLGREVERVKPEIEEKVEETKQGLWQRFKGLFE